MQASRGQDAPAPVDAKADAASPGAAPAGTPLPGAAQLGFAQLSTAQPGAPPGEPPPAPALARFLLPGMPSIPTPTGASPPPAQPPGTLAPDLLLPEARRAAGPPVRVLAIGLGQGGLGQAGRDLLGEGWCDPEPDATWTGAAQCTLHLRLPPGAGACLLRLRAAPFRAETVGFQRLGVLGQGLLLGRFQFDGGLQTVEVALPAALLDGAERLALTLLLPDAVRPADVSPSPDTRLLALHVHDLELLRLGRDPDAPEPAWPTKASSPEASLLLGFESLGSDAEFGFVQRRFGAEPSGLLRWAGTDAQGLAAGLAAGLAGVGEPDSLALSIRAQGWLATDRRWGLQRDVPADPALDEAAVRTLEARRQAVGRSRLLAALREGGRILVYKQRDPAEAALLPALADAVAQLGPAWLLWVGLEGEPGTVQAAGGRVLRGTLDRFAPPTNLADIDAAAWLALCREARRLATEAG